MEYFGSAQRREKETFLRVFSIYGYSKNELLSLLQWFVDFYFIESKEGLNVSKIREFFSSRKLGFYLHKLTKFIIYQENVRNDTYLTYKNPVHDYNTDLLTDVFELFHFYHEIMKYECQEYDYIKQHRRQGHVARYSSAIVGSMPICWRFLKGCRNRLKQLDRVISKNEDTLKNKLVTEFNALRSEILRRSENNEILPKISPEIEKRCPPLSPKDFDITKLL
jgi:hypothetical protein